MEKFFFSTIGKIKVLFIPAITALWLAIDQFPAVKETKEIYKSIWLIAKALILDFAQETPMFVIILSVGFAVWKVGIKKTFVTVVSLFVISWATLLFCYYYSPDSFAEIYKITEVLR